MAHYGTLRDYEFAKEAGDIRGSELYGLNDEKLGKIDDVIFDHSSGTLRYAVVDTGGWLSSRKFLVPANQVFARPDHDDDFAVNLTKEQVERFPVYDEKHVEHEHDFSDYEQRYRKQWTTDGDVMHKSGSTHILTPEPSELPAASGNAETLEGFNLTPERIADKFSDTAPDPNKTRMRPAGLASRAEDQRLPGSSAPVEKPTVVEEQATERRQPTSAQSGRDTIFGLYQDAPVDRSQDPQVAEQDILTNPDDLYVPAEQRHRRIQGFEDLLRRNRVDITSRCGSCSSSKDRAA